MRSLIILFAASAMLLPNFLITADEDALHPPAPFLRESTFNQDPAAGKLAGRLLRVKRPLFMVSDLGRALDFYVDVVGLEVYQVEATYNRDPDSLGYKMFNIPVGKPKRSATLNTSNEVRGLALQEVSDMEILVGQTPRNHTILFETDDILGITGRAAAAGHPVIKPVLADIPATDKAPRLRFVECGVIDPDGHVVAFFQYFNDDAAWAEAQRVFGE